MSINCFALENAILKPFWVVVSGWSSNVSLPSSLECHNSRCTFYALLQPNSGLVRGYILVFSTKLQPGVMTSTYYPRPTPPWVHGQLPLTATVAAECISGGKWSFNCVIICFFHADLLYKDHVFHSGELSFVLYQIFLSIWVPCADSSIKGWDFRYAEVQSFESAKVIFIFAP